MVQPRATISCTSLVIWDGASCSRTGLSSCDGHMGLSRSLRVQPRVPLVAAPSAHTIPDLGEEQSPWVTSYLWAGLGVAMKFSDLKPGDEIVVRQSAKSNEICRAQVREHC